MSSFPLDLSDADTSGFQPIDPGRYNGEIVKVEMDATTNPNGNLPVGTPMVKIQVKLLDEGVENRRVFDQFYLPKGGDDYDPRKAATLKGMFVNMLTALGYDEAQVKAGGVPDLEDLVGQTAVVVVGKEQKKDKSGNIVEGEFNNPIKGWKPSGSIETGATASQLL